MEFFQKHWARLSMALLFLLGGAATIVLYARDFDNLEGIVGWAPFIAAVLFFFGMSAVGFLKIFAPKFVGFVYFGIGAAITLLFTIILATEDFEGELLVNIYWWYAVPLIVFGIQPLIRGLIKFIESERPLPQPKAEAPKAAEKKAAK